MAENVKTHSPSKDKVSTMPIEIRQLLDFDDRKYEAIHYLMNLTNRLFLRNHQTTTYMKKRKLSTTKQEKQTENFKFSKNFFQIMDQDESGVIEVSELTYPLLALGLANNSHFIYRALKILNPKKFEDQEEEAQLNLKEFSEIFQTDAIQEKLI